MIDNRFFEIVNFDLKVSTGPDADNELDDSQAVLRLRRFDGVRCKHS